MYRVKTASYRMRAEGLPNFMMQMMINMLPNAKPINSTTNILHAKYRFISLLILRCCLLRVSSLNDQSFRCSLSKSLADY